MTNLAICNHSAKAVAMYPPTNVILADLLCKAANPPMSFCQHVVGQQSATVFCHQNLSYNFNKLVTVSLEY